MEPHIVDSIDTPYTASFIATWGDDTASVETFTLAGNHLFGRAIHLYPEPHLRQFAFHFNPDGSMRALDMQFFDIHNPSRPLESQTGLPLMITMRSRDQVVDFRLIDGSGEKQYTHLVPRMDFLGGWIPIFGQWQWLTDRLLTNRLGDNLQFLNYAIGDYALRVYERAAGEVVFESDISPPITLFLDKLGKIDSVNTLGSPWNYRIHRTEEVLNLADFTAQFARKEVIGDPSPSQKLEKEMLGADLTLEYDRPYRRGRIIFGEVVPYGAVWRTGAGLPTRLTTTRDLVFGGQTLPAGTYNIFTIPERDGWTLIFNTEENAWGSAYRSEYDLFHVPMQVESLPQAVDQFTMSLEERAGRGYLNLMWENTKAFIAFDAAE